MRPHRFVFLLLIFPALLCLFVLLAASPFALGQYKGDILFVELLLVLSIAIFGFIGLFRSRAHESEASRVSFRKALYWAIASTLIFAGYFAFALIGVLNDEGWLPAVLAVVLLGPLIAAVLELRFLSELPKSTQD